MIWRELVMVVEMEMAELCRAVRKCGDAGDVGMGRTVRCRRGCLYGEMQAEMGVSVRRRADPCGAEQSGAAPSRPAMPP